MLKIASARRTSSSFPFSSFLITKVEVGRKVIYVVSGLVHLVAVPICTGRVVLIKRVRCFDVENARRNVRFLTDKKNYSIVR